MGVENTVHDVITRHYIAAGAIACSCGVVGANALHERHLADELRSALAVFPELRRAGLSVVAEGPVSARLRLPAGARLVFPSPGCTVVEIEVER